MPKMKSWEELKKIREEAASGTNLRTTGENPDRIVLAVGMATCGIAAGARTTMEALFDEVAKAKLDNVSIISTGCFGFCYAEPMVEVRMPDQPPIRYGYVDDKLAREIVQKHLLKGQLIDNAIISKEVRRP